MRSVSEQRPVAQPDTTTTFPPTLPRLLDDFLRHGREYVEKDAALDALGRERSEAEKNAAQAEADSAEKRLTRAAVAAGAVMASHGVACVTYRGYVFVHEPSSLGAGASDFDSVAWPVTAYPVRGAEVEAEPEPADTPEPDDDGPWPPDADSYPELIRLARLARDHWRAMVRRLAEARAARDAWRDGGGEKEKEGEWDRLIRVTAETAQHAEDAVILAVLTCLGLADNFTQIDATEGRLVALDLDGELFIVSHDTDDHGEPGLRRLTVVPNRDWGSTQDGQGVLAETPDAG